MYPPHWGLQESPFCTRPEPRAFYESPTHEEGLARLQFLVEQGRRLGLLLGPAGSGKSLLLSVFARQLRRQGTPVAKLSLLGVGSNEMLALLATELAASAISPMAPLPTQWRAVADRLAEFRYQHMPVVLLFDDADQADPAVLTQVTRLVLHDPSPETQRTIVLAAHSEGLTRLHPRQLELAELRIDLDAWEPLDTREYLNSSLAAAGCRTAIFDEKAIERLHELAHGIPRRVSQLADLALLAGAGGELDHVDATTVESVYHELGVVEV